MAQIEKDNVVVIKRELSKRKRNTMLIHLLGIPYFWGKKVEKITLTLGIQAGRTARRSGRELGTTLEKKIRKVEILVDVKEK